MILQSYLTKYTVSRSTQEKGIYIGRCIHIDIVALYSELLRLYPVMEY